MPNLINHLEGKVAEANVAKGIGEAMFIIGLGSTFPGLLLGLLVLTLIGFAVLLVGFYLTVHFELKRLDYISMIERFSEPTG